MENAIYGGRVDNTFDMRVLYSYLEQIFNDDVIPGQAVTPTRGVGKRGGLPFGNIPVSARTKVGGEGEGQGEGQVKRKWEISA